MPRRCSVCDSSERNAIELTLAANKSPFSAIARKFGLGRDAVTRHKELHMSPALARAAARREELSADKIVEKLVALVHRIEMLLEKAESAGDLGASGKLIKELRETLVTVGKTVGLWQERSGVFIDARTQLAAFGDLSTDDLQKLARLSSRQGCEPKSIVEGSLDT